MIVFTGRKARASADLRHDSALIEHLSDLHSTWQAHYAGSAVHTCRTRSKSVLLPVGMQPHACSGPMASSVVDEVILNSDRLGQGYFRNAAAYTAA